MNIDQTIIEARKLLNDNPEWKDRYAAYAKQISSNLDFIKESMESLEESDSLFFYINTSKAKEATSKLTLDLRYRGQSVATVTVKAGEVKISTAGKDKRNDEHFDCKIELNNASWESEEAKEFRRFFENRDDTRNNTVKKNEEHNLESLLLTEFSKESSDGKQLLNIQPVTLGGIRYVMPTPLKASNKKLEYSDQHGGHIDILARTDKGSNSKLLVIEVKDESKPDETPMDALKQAIKYAVFIRELLRSESRKEWYKIFGINSSVDNKLTIRVACAMPDDIFDESFKKQTFDIDGDVIECHYIYFKYNGQEILNLKSSLSPSE